MNFDAEQHANYKKPGWHESCQAVLWDKAMRSFLPSRIDCNGSEKTIQLQFTGVSFELCLFEHGNAVTRAVAISASQLRQVSIDLRVVEVPPLKLLYEDRHVVIQVKAKSWVKVPDVQFLNLIDFAVRGQGQGMQSRP